MKRIILLLICILLVGCASLRQLDYKIVSSSTTTSTEIITEPPGARIEIDNDYIGDAPLYVEIKAPVTLFGEVNRPLYIIAIPNEPGQYKQVKNLHGKNVPKRVFFNMNLAPVPRQLEIEIK